jgi:hypothetical protein
MGAFGDIGTRGLFFDAQRPTSPTGFLGLWGLGCRGMNLAAYPTIKEPRGSYLISWRTRHDSNV